VGEGKGPFARHVVSGRHKLGLKARWQGVGAEIGNARELVQRQPLGSACGIDNEAVPDVEVLWLRLQDRSSAGKNVRAQRLAGLPGGFSTNACRARSPGPAAIGRVVRVAGDDADSLDGNAKGAGCNLRNDRLGALSLLRHSGVADEGALRIELHRDAVLRGNLCAANAVKRGRRV